MAEFMNVAGVELGRTFPPTEVALKLQVPAFSIRSGIQIQFI